MSDNTKDDGMLDELLWLDIESGGLDPGLHPILEVAAVVTTPELDRVTDTFHRVICPADPWSPESMDDDARDMHATSGLLAAIEHGDIDFDVYTEFCEFVERHPGAYLAGSGVHFDRGFIAAHWGSEVLAPLHYRNVDVSTLRTFAALYASDVKYEPTKAHRAMDDVLDAIAELRHYRRVFVGAVDTLGRMSAALMAREGGWAQR